MLTSFPRSENRINRSRRRGIVESDFLATLFLRPFRYENCDRRFSQWPFTANASHWYEAVLRAFNRIEPVLLRQRKALASVFSRSRTTAREIAMSSNVRHQQGEHHFDQEDAPLPSTISMESEAFLPGWRMVKNLDRQALTREVVAANLKLSYLAGEIQATVLGRKNLRALRRAAECVLARQEEQHFKFNSLEFTKVVSKRFLGIPVMSVRAHSRCIQQGFGLAAPRIPPALWKSF